MVLHATGFGVTTILIVFGRYDARSDWLRKQAREGKDVFFVRNAVVIDGPRTILAKVIKSERDYGQLQGFEFSEVIEDPSFVAPDSWPSFIASRIRKT